MKQCYKCKQTKPFSEFNKHKNKPDGHGSECRACITRYKSSVSGKTSRLFSSCKRRAKLAQGAVTITKDWLREKLNAGVCELTGLPFNFNGRDEHTRQAYAPSVDRIDSKNPNYTPENCRLVLWAVNCSMAEYGEEIMLPIFKAILNAKEKSTTSIPTGSYLPGAVGTELGSVSTSWTWENGDDLNDYRGATQGENSYRSAKEGSGVSVGHGGQEVGAFDVFDYIESSGALETAPRRLREAFERLRSQFREPSLAAGTASEIRQFGD